MLLSYASTFARLH